MKWVLGVDEAGRGPLAGPIAVGVVMVPEGFSVAREFRGVRDSKQLSENAREKFYAMLRERAKNGDVSFCVRFSHASVIDRRGITRATHNAIIRGMRFLAPSPESVRVLLDGLLHAPDEYAQRTVIGGDERIPLIALASIAAKVARDRKMRSFAKLYPAYGFAAHKGYGTDAHYAALRKYGPSNIHRLTFL